MPPLVSIQNPRPEKLHDAIYVERLPVLVLWKKKKVPDMGGNGVKKTESKISGTQSTKTGKCSRLPSCNFSGPGFWMLAKGGIRQPVLSLPYTNSIQVLGMEQPSALGPVIMCIPEPRRGGVTDYSSPGSEGRVRPGPGFLQSRVVHMEGNSNKLR